MLCSLLRCHWVFILQFPLINSQINRYQKINKGIETANLNFLNFITVVFKTIGRKISFRNFRVDGNIKMQKKSVSSLLKELE